MANWFKLFETDLDESRMRFALSKLPEVWPVWTAVLMECCKHRSDNFAWGTDAQELFGFSDRLKLTIEKVNLAITLLCDIKYTELSEGRIKVLKWNEKQDDYLARKSRGYWEKRRENNSITVNHSNSHIEERRGEEKRRDKRKPVEGVVYSPESRVALHYLNEKSGRKFREMESSLSVIQARLNEPGVDIAGIRKMIDRQCRRWKGTTQEEYLRPETLFGKTKFDGYYAAKDLEIPAANGKPDASKVVGGRL